MSKTNTSRDDLKSLATLDTALLRGLADADAGWVKPAATVARRLIAKYEGMAKAKKNDHGHEGYDHPFISS
jgi:hypothetical protein